MAINNPYVPGDPFSYDLKWLVRKIKEHSALLENIESTLDQKIADAIMRYLDQHDPLYWETAADLISSDMKAPSLAYIEGYYAKGDGGANLYFVTSDYNDVLAAPFYLTLDGPNRWAIPIIVTPYVTPEMFGAHGDRSEDDTDAIQKTVDVAKDLSIGTVIFSRHYLMTHVHVYEGQTMKGMGGDIMVPDNYCVDSSQNYYIFENYGEDAVTFDGLTMYGNSANNTQFRVCDMITALEKHTVVKNCRLYDCIDSGIMFSAVDGGQCIENMIDGAPDCGIYVNSGTLNNLKGCVISGNTIRNCSASAIAAKRICSKSIIDSNNIEDCQFGITMENASTPDDFSTDIAITNNWIYNMSSAGIDVRGGFNHVISGNTVIICDRGIMIEECSEVTVTGNIVETNSMTPGLSNRSSCVWVTYRSATPVCKNVVISCNTLKTHGGRTAIVFGDSVALEWDSITITGNAIDLDTHAIPIDVRGGSYMVNSIISNNTFVSTVKMRLGLSSANNDVIISNNQGDYYVLSSATTTALRLAPFQGALYTGAIAQRIINLPATSTALTTSTYKKGDLVFTGNTTGVILYLATADGVGTGVLTALINV